MPELAEVQTIATQLNEALTGLTLTAADVHRDDWVSHGHWRALTGRQIAEVRRWGKRLVIATEEPLAVIGLGMTGRFDLNPAQREKHTLATFTFHNPHSPDRAGIQLAYVDPRRFGSCHVFDNPAQADRVLGPRIGLDAAGTYPAQKLAEHVGKGRMALHGALLDQARIAGIGNYLAAEIAHRAHISPQRPVNTITSGEWEQINEARRTVIGLALEHGGLTISDYRDAQGNKGSMSDHLLVYGRAGQPCKACSTPLEEGQVAGRTVAWCPACQP